LDKDHQAFGPKILIIAGMHRSGTSVLSQWLHQCGLHLGDRLLGPAIGNTEGHFEDLDFLQFHEEILEENASGYTHAPISGLSVYQKEKLKSVIGFKNSLHQEWGWKEPRTCLFLDHYKDLVPGAYYLVIIRNYGETVSSLLQRELKELDKYYLSKSWLSNLNWKKRKRAQRAHQLYTLNAECYLKVWITYNQALLKTIENLPASQFIVTAHELLREQHTDIFDTLVNKWKFCLQQADFRKIYKKSLLSEVTDIDPFVEDKHLLDKARALEFTIKSYVQPLPFKN